MSKFRICGGCTACCKTHSVKEIAKPAGEWCSHCLSDQCRIYETRPKGCRDFVCQWIKGFGENSERPDLVNIVVDMVTYEHVGMTVILFEVVKGALKKSFALDTSAFMQQRRMPVLLVPVRGEPRLLVPSHLSWPEDIRCILEDGREVLIET